MKLYKYRIHFMNTFGQFDYVVVAKDAFDAKVMGEVWQKRWGSNPIESISCEGEERP